MIANTKNTNTNFHFDCRGDFFFIGMDDLIAKIEIRSKVFLFKLFCLQNTVYWIGITTVT